MKDTIAIIDFETTGLHAAYGDRIIEVGAVLLQSQRITDRFQQLINPGMPIPRVVTALTGIDDDLVRNAPKPANVLRDLLAFVRGVPLVAHNACFDRGFLDHELDRLGKRREQEFVCTMRVARRVYPEADNHRLSTLVENVGLSRPARAHRALADAEVTAELWTRMEQDLSETYGLSSIPLELMIKLQRVAVAKAATYVSRFGQRLNKAELKNLPKKPSTEDVSDRKAQTPSDQEQGHHDARTNREPYAWLDKLRRGEL